MDAVAERPIARQRSASNCRWATPTLFLRAPFWFDAEACPWTCLRDAAPRVLSTTDPCATCPRWEPREIAPANTPDQRPAEAAATAAVPLLVDWLGGSPPPHEAE
jgi:hypothetical protein